MEEEAFVRLGEGARHALEENAILLRQVNCCYSSNALDVLLI